MWCLYLVTNLVNGKQYVGITNNCERRWREHLSGHGSKLVFQAMRKYGRKNLVFDVLLYASEHTVKQFEVKYIAHLNTVSPAGYNLTGGGEGSTGWVPTGETRQKMSQSATGQNNPMYGKKHSKETRRKMSFRARARKPITGISQARPGPSNPRARRVLVDDKEFGCIKDAAKHLGLTASHLRTKFSRYNKTNNWPEGWTYL